MTYKVWTQTAWLETRTDLAETFRKWGVRDWVIEPVKGRTDALNPVPVTVRYRHPVHGEQHLTYGKQSRPQDNLRVIYLALESMRLNERRGIADLVREAYLALPAPTVRRDPYEVLGVRSDAAPEVIKAAYLALAKQHINDADPSTMQAINAAWEALREAVQA